jgi:hypothetical protein
MPNKGFLLAEDAAVKNRFSNLTVSDDRNQERTVQVFFRYPEGETEKAYPFITIEMVNLSHDTRRQLSETYYYYSNTASASNSTSYIDYYPSEMNAAELAALNAPNSALKLHSLIPVNLMYQVTTYTRTALHDRQLSSKILRRVVPFRTGFIEIPEDGTIRRFDLLSWSTSDLLDREAGYRKRIFRKVFTIQMNAEIADTDFSSVPLVGEFVRELNTDTNSSSFPTATNISEEF